jgi:hypothetical protein
VIHLAISLHVRGLEEEINALLSDHIERLYVTAESEHLAVERARE